MEIGNQYVNCANLKNRREIREDGKPQIQTKQKKKKNTHTHTHTKGQALIKGKRKKVKTWSDRRNIGELKA